MTFQLVERTLADAIAEGRADGPRWVVEPGGELETGCIWARRALFVVPLFVPILPPDEIYISDFHVYAPSKHRRLLRPEFAASVGGHLQQLVGATGRPALVVGGSPNYYHWLIDFLPKLWILARAPALQSLPLIVNGDFSRGQEDALAFTADALGIPMPQIGVGNPSGLVGVVDAHIPTHVSRLAGVAFWRRVIERTSLERAGPPRRRLLVSRAGAARRRLKDEAVLAARLARDGFETVDAAALSFPEQVALFADARIIVGVHGAGLTNAVFAPREATLIELHDDTHTEAYWAIATARRQNYVRIPLVAVPDSHRNPAHRDVTLSPDGTAMLLRAIAEAR